MTSILSFSSIVVCVVVIASAACAQSEARRDIDGAPATVGNAPTSSLLTLPTDTLIRCSSAAVGRGATHAYRFETGSGALSENRLITAEYDSAGQPVALREMTDARSATIGTTADAVFALFRAGEVIGGAHSRDVERPDPTSGDTSFRMKELTPPQKQQARELALWLWPRRCSAAR